MADTGAPPRAADTKVQDSRVLAEAGKRRAFAVISHPDAGKSTLTQALALHASAITQAGAVHGKAGRRGVTSDWMWTDRAPATPTPSPPPPPPHPTPRPTLL